MSKLALFGGTPTLTQPFPKWPQFDQEEVIAATTIVKSGIWDSSHPITSELEAQFASFQGTRYALAVTNGSQTMEIILRALGVGIGDEVIVPAYTFIATAMAVLMVGAIPIIVDVQHETMTLDPIAVRKAITDRTKAIMPVHIAGVTGAIAEILQLAQQYNLFVIEDCAHAHGATYRSQGAGGLGIAGSFSFQGGKVITAGEGGMITTNDKALYEACWSLREGGIPYPSASAQSNGTDLLRIGSNYNMTAIQSAITLVQMRRFSEQKRQRLENADRLDQHLRKISGIIPQYRHFQDEAPGYLYLFYYEAKEFNGLSRQLFVKALQAEGVPAGLSGYPPLYRTNLFRDRTFAAGGKQQHYDLSGNPCPDYAALSLPVVEQIDREVICLPHSTLIGTTDQIDAIAEAIQKIQTCADQGLPVTNKIVFSIASVGKKISNKVQSRRGTKR
jgi:dTDP-4-amino-4,6-dideoxygalactose transaminase